MSFGPLSARRGVLPVHGVQQGEGLAQSRVFVGHCSSRLDTNRALRSLAASASASAASAFAFNLAGACPRRRTRSRLWLALCEPPHRTSLRHSARACATPPQGGSDRRAKPHPERQGRSPTRERGRPARILIPGWRSRSVSATLPAGSHPAARSSKELFAGPQVSLPP